MTRATVPTHRRDRRWTAEDLAGSYEDLAALEPLGEGSTHEAAAPEPGGLELLATVEARAPGDAPSSPAARRPRPPSRASADAETYAVLPALEVLTPIADHVRAVVREEAAQASAPRRRVHAG